MNNIVALQPQGSVRDYTATQLTLIKKTVAKDCNNDEFDLFVEICRRVGLDPFRKQIYGIVTNKDKKEKRQLVVVTGIDGYRAIAARNKDYRPAEDEPEIFYADEAKEPEANPLGIIRATVTVFKRDSGGDWHPIKGTAYWEEFAPIVEGGEWKETGEVYEDSGKAKKSFVRNGKMALDPNKSNWRKMARVMIAKCAEAQALRKGWPEDLSGIYVHEELDQAAMVDITPSETIEQAAIEDRLNRIGAKHTIPFQWTGGGDIQYVPLGQAADRVFEFLNAAESPTQVETWQRINAIGLRQFWAISKSDALEVKKAIETRINQLSKSEVA